MNNADTVRGMYGAFRRGDIAAIVDRCAVDIEWEYHPSAAGVPWLAPRQGHDGVRAFFASLGDFEFLRFEPSPIADLGDGLVIALVDVALILKRNGYRIREPEEVHLFRFDADGKLMRFRHSVDTHRLWLAHHA